MWPFSSKNKKKKKKKATPIPTIRCGNISVRWNAQLHWWQFSDGEIDYSLAGNPEFDVAILNSQVLVRRWLTDLDQEIDAEIKKHLEGWCEWTGEKHVVSVDVSNLVSKDEIDIAYAGGDNWGDLGVNIVMVFDDDFDASGCDLETMMLLDHATADTYVNRPRLTSGRQNGTAAGAGL